MPIMACGLAVLFATPAIAVPTMSLSWDTCSSPIVSTRQPEPGVNTYTLYLTATGVEEAHKAYEVAVWFAGEQFCSGPSEPSVPDAWRFDGAGCQDSIRLTLGFAQFGRLYR